MKKNDNLGEQLATLAKGCRSISVDGESCTPAKNRPRQKLTPDPRWTVPDEKLNGIESSITVVMQCRTKCMNAREHWRDRAKRVREEHAELQILLAAHELKRERLATGCTVKMARIGRKVDDDNLRGYLKAVRDYVAFWILGGHMGERDSDPAIEWIYDQRQLGKAFGVVVTIEPKGIT